MDVSDSKGDLGERERAREGPGYLRESSDHGKPSEGKQTSRFPSNEGTTRGEQRLETEQRREKTKAHEILWIRRRSSSSLVFVDGHDEVSLSVTDNVRRMRIVETLTMPTDLFGTLCQWPFVVCRTLRVQNVKCNFLLPFKFNICYFLKLLYRYRLTALFTNHFLQCRTQYLVF